jgi:hypothetical protein
MNHPLFPFRRFLVALLFYPLLAGGLFALYPITEQNANELLAHRFPNFPLYRALLIAILMLSWGFGLLMLRWFWRFAPRVRRFRTYSTSRVVLHYAPQLQDRWDFGVFCERCVSELDDLEQRFGFSLRGRLIVYLFPTRADVSEVFGKWYAGTALAFANAIVVAADFNLQEVLRHEMIHLFAARWGQAPPLLNEGLATWLQSTPEGREVDWLARRYMEISGVRLSQLLSRKFSFRVPRSAYYYMGGSFTGFLIRRFGWDEYRAFFRKACSANLPRTFRKRFGISLDEAERMWRDELLSSTSRRRRAWGGQTLFGRRGRV